MPDDDLLMAHRQTISYQFQQIGKSRACNETRPRSLCFCNMSEFCKADRSHTVPGLPKDELELFPSSSSSLNWNLIRLRLLIQFVFVFELQLFPSSSSIRALSVFLSWCFLSHCACSPPHLAPGTPLPSPRFPHPASGPQGPWALGPVPRAI